MRRRKTKSTAVEQWLPLGYFGAALLLTMTLLPTVLRPPQQAPTQTAEFSPDAPPDDNQQALISSMTRASSSTAGAVETGGEGEGVGGVAPVAPVPTAARACPFGYGNPPRQTESVYSPPCAPAFQGNNGGSTWKNVTGDEIRIGFSHVVGNAAEGPIPTEARQGESGPTRTMRVLQEYWNRAMQTYGRRIRLYQLPAGSADPAEQVAAATQADEEYKLFATSYLYPEFCKEIARRRLISFCNPMPASFYNGQAPYMWGWMPDFDLADAMGAEYICKKLKDKPAEFAGPGVQGQPRKYGVLVENAGPRNGGRTGAQFQSALKAECGIDSVYADFNNDDTQAQGSFGTAVSRLRSAGVTSVVLLAETGPSIAAMAAADGQGWSPEWLIWAAYGLDGNTIGLLLPQSQMRHAFGLTAWEMPTQVDRTECGKAYKSIDKAGSADGTTCFVFFHYIQMILNGIQLAGPELTPQSFERGLMSLGRRVPPEPWAIGGGYGPGKHTYQDAFAEIWWDPNGTAPETGARGAWRRTYNGARFGRHELPSDTNELFKGGITAMPT